MFYFHDYGRKGKNQWRGASIRQKWPSYTIAPLQVRQCQGLAKLSPKHCGAVAWYAATTRLRNDWRDDSLTGLGWFPIKDTPPPPSQVQPRNSQQKLVVRVVIRCLSFFPFGGYFQVQKPSVFGGVLVDGCASLPLSLILLQVFFTC